MSATIAKQTMTSGVDPPSAPTTAPKGDICQNAFIYAISLTDDGFADWKEHARPYGQKLSPPALEREGGGGRDVLRAALEPLRALTGLGVRMPVFLQRQGERERERERVIHHRIDYTSTEGS